VWIGEYATLTGHKHMRFHTEEQCRSLLGRPIAPDDINKKLVLVAPCEGVYESASKLAESNPRYERAAAETRRLSDLHPVYRDEAFESLDRLRKNAPERLNLEKEILEGRERMAEDLRDAGINVGDRRRFARGPRDEIVSEFGVEDFNRHSLGTNTDNTFSSIHALWREPTGSLTAAIATHQSGHILQPPDQLLPELWERHGKANVLLFRNRPIGETAGECQFVTAEVLATLDLNARQKVRFDEDAYAAFVCNRNTGLDRSAVADSLLIEREVGGSSSLWDEADRRTHSNAAFATLTHESDGPSNGAQQRYDDRARGLHSR
jgi:hypothetical protein